MKELKTFFNNDNRLNKGYEQKNVTKRQPDNIFYRKKFEHTLPPIDVISEYEEINPGTLAELIDMAKKEQNHRHSIDLVNIDAHNRAMKFARISTLTFVMLICITTVALTIITTATIALVFSGLAFTALSSVVLCSFLNTKKAYKNEHIQNTTKANQEKLM